MMEWSGARSQEGNCMAIGWGDKVAQHFSPPVPVGFAPHGQ